MYIFRGIIICTLLLSACSALGEKKLHLSPVLEKDAEYLEKILVAPCCWNQTLAAHNSPETERMKEEIRLMLVEGEKVEDIIRIYTDKYGNRILSSPPPGGFHILLYWLPPAFLIITAFFFIIYAKRLSQRSARNKRSNQPSEEEEINDNSIRHELREQLQRELDELD